MARRKKSKGIGKLLVAGVLVVAAAAGAAYYGATVLHWGMKPPPSKAVVSVTPGPSVTETRTVYIYLPVQDKRGFHLHKSPVNVRADGESLDSALNALIATNKQSGMVSGLIPKGTKLVSPIEVKHGIATANLSHDFVDNFSGGSDQEAITLNSIIHTLVCNGGGKVKSVQILIEGKKVESLGVLPLDAPVGPESTILHPGGGN